MEITLLNETPMIRARAKYLFIILTFFILAHPLYSMDRAPSIIHFTQEELNQYVINDKDPPLLKISLSNNRFIYLLGSIHNRNPNILLSKNVLDEIVKIAPHSTFITENSPIASYTYLKEKFNIAKQTNKIKWDVTQTIKDIARRKIELEQVTSDRIDNWKQVQCELVLEGFKKCDVEYMDKADGMLTLYFILNLNYNFLLDGFETTLRKLTWGKVLYLEKISKVFGTIIEKHDETKFFESSFAVLEKNIGVAKNKELIYPTNFSNHLASIRAYEFDKLLTAEVIESSTEQRNTDWSTLIADYVEHYSKEGEQIFIVCGLAHLKNLYKTSLLARLVEAIRVKNKFSITKIERMSKDGNLITLWPKVDK